MKELRLLTAEDYPLSIEPPYLVYTVCNDNVHVPSSENVTSATFNANCTVSEEKDETVQPNNEIWYTTTDGNVCELYDASLMGTTYAINLVSNTYEDGIGKMVFDSDVTQLSYNEADETGMPIGDFYPAFASFDSDSTLETVQLPSSVTIILDAAFSNCRGLTSIEIPSSVTTIGAQAFYDCTSLTSVTIPSSVTSIWDGAFTNCRGLTSIEIPSSVTSIDRHTFYYCDSLTSVTIPSSVTTIGGLAFKNCESLTSIEIPSSVTSIGEDAFEYCYSLTSVTFAEGSQLTSIGSSAFWDCTNITSITYKGVTYTSKSALTTALTDNGVTVNSSAFNGTGLSD